MPLLGDLPLLGALFRSESRERRRTNLIVFLRPIVMRDAESANRFSIDRYEQIRGRQQASQPPPSVVLPINEAAVLPRRRRHSHPADRRRPCRRRPGRRRPAGTRARRHAPGQPTAP